MSREKQCYWIALLADGTYKELWGTKEEVSKWLDEREYTNYRLVKWED